MLGAQADPTLSAEARVYAQQHLTTTILATKNLFDWGSADSSLLACASTLLKPAH